MGQQLSLFPEETVADDEPDDRYDHTKLFERLSQSKFRSRFHLSDKDAEYIRSKGMDAIRRHAMDFVARFFPP